jgi:CRP/FNR family transcriptional regulator, cyclic AMP receptor protein
MAWTRTTIETMNRPKFLLAMMQLVVKRSADFMQRIESSSVHGIAGRLGRALVRFSERIGSRPEEGWIRIDPLTHEFLAQYVGTSREIVTHSMVQFRRNGLVTYSRKCILLNVDLINAWLGAVPSVPQSLAPRTPIVTVDGQNPLSLAQLVDNPVPASHNQKP